jgi:hypothetical protein
MDRHFRNCDSSIGTFPPLSLRHLLECLEQQDNAPVERSLDVRLMPVPIDFVDDLLRMKVESPLTLSAEGSPRIMPLDRWIEGEFAAVRKFVDHLPLASEPPTAKFNELYCRMYETLWDSKHK